MGLHLRQFPPCAGGMDTLFQDFKESYALGSGPLLSSTLVPIAPSDDPNRLRRFVKFTDPSKLSSDIAHGISTGKNHRSRLSRQEETAWVDVYSAYWRAIDEVVALEEERRSDHNAIYNAWKELTNCLIKGYQGSLFAAWTVPCLYVAGRYLRVFAVNADEHGQGADHKMIEVGMQDDIAVSSNKNEKLEDAARVINRIFTLCISDRYGL